MARNVEAGDECDDEEAASLSRGRGAIAIATSPGRLYAGYPSHCRPDLTHLVHCGRVSSHLTLRFLRSWRLAHARSYGYDPYLLAIIASRLNFWSTCPLGPDRPYAFSWSRHLVRSCQRSTVVVCEPTRASVHARLWDSDGLRQHLRSCEVCFGDCYVRCGQASAMARRRVRGETENEVAPSLVDRI